MKVKTVYKTILSYCLQCQKNTESKNPKVVKTKNRIITLLSKCVACNSKKQKFSRKLIYY